jgi:SH3 domain
MIAVKKDLFPLPMSSLLKQQRPHCLVRFSSILVKIQEDMVRHCTVYCQELVSRVTVRGLYDYPAQGPDELGIGEGEMIELSGGPNGGQNYGDGWWEGMLDAIYSSDSG